MWASPLSRIRDGGVFLGQAVGAGGGGRRRRLPQFYLR